MRAALRPDLGPGPEGPRRRDDPPVPPRGRRDRAPGVQRDLRRPLGLDPPGRRPLGAEYADAKSFRPRHSFVAETDGRIVGYLLTAEFEGETQARGYPTGYVSRIGTVRAARGRGIADALLAHTMADLAAHGYPFADLAVDADSPTGAGRLYEQGRLLHDRPEHGGRPPVLNDLPEGIDGLLDIIDRVVEVEAQPAARGGSMPSAWCASVAQWQPARDSTPASFSASRQLHRVCGRATLNATSELRCVPHRAARRS